MMEIELPPHSMMSLVHEAHKNEDPQQYLNSMLDPYYISDEQVHYITTELVWNHNQRVPHPMSQTVKNIQSIPPGKKKVSSAKQVFVTVSTALPHLWCKGAGGLMIRDKLCFAPYGEENKPAPYVWINLDQFSNLEMIYANYQSPFRIRVQRKCGLGELAPYEMDFYEEYGAAYDDRVEVTLNLSTPVGGGGGATVPELASHCYAPRKSNKENFIILLSSAFKFIGCYYVSPTTWFVWKYPVLMHVLE